MNIGQLIKRTTEYFKKNNIQNFSQEAEMLLGFVLKKPESFLYTHPEYKLNVIKKLYLNYLINKRLRGYSLATITKEKEFYGYKFVVNKNTLIPRPETEMMVEFALEIIKPINKENVLLIDVGTGTGCIPITIINELNKINYPLSNVNCNAIDISKKALKIAKLNAKMFEIIEQISFFKGNLLKPVIDIINNYSGKIIITANLPYLSPNQIKNSPSIAKEPKLALIAGVDGLDCYRELYKQISSLKGQQDITLFCEIDPGQSKNILKLIKEKLPKYFILIKKDLRGFDRFVVISSQLLEK